MNKKDRLLTDQPSAIGEEMMRISPDWEINPTKDLGEQLGVIKEYEMWLREREIKKSARQSALMK